MAEAGAVVVIGDVMTDILVRPEGPIVAGSDRRAEIRTIPGGGGGNQAAWLAHHGARVRLAARVAAADRARLAAAARADGVEPWLGADPDRATGVLVALVGADGERSFLTDRGANLGLCAADLPDALLEGARLVHVSGYALMAPGPRAAVLGFLDRARAAGLAVSVDPGSASFLAEMGPAAFLDGIAGADFFFPNAAEAEILTDLGDPEAQLARLAPRFGRVALKRGARGAMLAHGPARWSNPAPRVAAIDTTGAGDAFLGAFLAAWLRGAENSRCLEVAIAAGAAATTALGARPPRMAVSADAAAHR
ncbi:MAG: ribokinase [Rhodovulum sulfidophilum]|uniref:Ribokinase n=1 Tax=Rhodovulum sulfidophilum TaxID=35806 RepID=A0A2W5Q2X0_RHOSU|nr:MAG: ribokinase [Rhodovulum sulfidophilum]